MQQRVDRRQRKAAQELLRNACYVRRMREDIAPAEAMARLRTAERDMSEMVQRGDGAGITKAMKALENAIVAVAPGKRFPALREYVEIAAVALAVAMGFRAYFIQPFKIPTGSMQPSLYGIHYIPAGEAGVSDRFPLNSLKWLVLGHWYEELKADYSGVITAVGTQSRIAEEGAQLASSGVMPVPGYIEIDGGYRQGLPPNVQLRVGIGSSVVRGQTVIASGIRVAGDHVFVDKLSWNFRPPRRSEVMVFITKGIEKLGTNKHYIKRTCGLPGEKIAIEPPYLKVNGVLVEDGAIGAIARRDGIYTDRPNGYVPTGSEPEERDFLADAGQEMTLGPDEYLCLGDNTEHSLDGRYWGPVKARNTLGPAVVVYWPFSSRWGLIRR